MSKIDFYPSQVDEPPHRYWKVAIIDSSGYPIENPDEYCSFELTRIGSVNGVDFYRYSHADLSMHKRAPRTNVEQYFYDRHFLAVARSEDTVLKVPAKLVAPYSSPIHDRDDFLRQMATAIRSGVLMSNTIVWSPSKRHTKNAMEAAIKNPSIRRVKLVMPSLAYVDPNGNVLAIPYQTLFKSYTPTIPIDMGKWLSCMYYSITKAIRHTDEAQTKLSAAEIWLPSLVTNATFEHGLVMDDSELDKGVFPYRMNRFAGYSAMKRIGNTLLVSVNGKSVDGHTQVIKVTYDAVAGTVLIEAEVSHWNKRGHNLRKYYDANDRESIKQALSALAFLLRNGLASIASVKKYRNRLKAES